MKFKADRATLMKSLAHVQNVVEKRNTIPILANVLLAVRDGKLTIAATDLEIALVEEVAAQTMRDGAITVPATTLYEIVRRQPDNVEIELDHPGGDAPLALRAGRYATSLVGLSVDEFPKLDAGKLTHQFVLSAQELRGLIDRTRFAISTEETRYYLNGIFLHAAESEAGPVLRAVATDGHRLARVEEPLPAGAKGMPGVIIPRKTVTELRKLLDEVSTEADVALSETRIQFTIGTMRLTSKLIDGTFPDYERVIPRGNDKVLRVEKKDFNDAVGRVSAISAERHRPVKLSLAKDLLVISASSPEQGTASEELGSELIDYQSGPLEIGFQARYLSDVTDQIRGKVEFVFADGAAPTLVRDQDDQSAVYVLMPMRV
ncbi:MAG TPA: DNA polymerase III subunit beta [Acidocella sp.]|jgi:DNA polymerase-3 subunit beta|uniref:DNA polymerase III subunit beta n=1 Tax=Acidocella sp. TaxID=50710 RepID=UPI002CD521F9|nr:DNA polymerase III subunit beta [Acidocella sp.]HVE21251.1 DNA polymerase III subunit beta [Acidocella sp.]